VKGREGIEKYGDEVVKEVVERWRGILLPTVIGIILKQRSLMNGLMDE